MYSSETEKTLQSSSRMETLIGLAFNREVIGKVSNVIAPLNDVGSGAPFYCVHSIGGGATEFQYLARMLGPNQRFYAIQAPTKRRNAEFAESIQAMSSYYVDELVKFQPDGFFLLGGYSAGATIALEMAQQLVVRGREVRLLVVLDGELFNTGAEMSPVHPLYWLKLLGNVPRWLLHELLKNRRRFASKWPDRLRSRVLERRQTARSASHAVEQFLDLDRFSATHAAFIKQLYDTQLAYVPLRYSGPALVFVAKTHALFRLRQVRAAWSKIAPLSEISEVDCTHVSMMRMPHGWSVASRLRKAIEDSR